MEIVQNLFRTLMFFLDNIVYGLIPQIYKLFIYLSQLNLFGGDNDNPLQMLINRVYVLLGIFMLFRVSFSLLQYIVDPNAFRDSSKGMGKLVTNVLVVLVLLVSVPSIFQFAYDLQSRIVQNNVIGELILGSSMSDNSGKMTPERVETMAKDVQFMMFGAFYSLNPDVTADGALFSSCNGTTGVFGSRDMATINNGECLKQLNEEISNYDDASANGVNLYSFFKYSGNGENCINGVCDNRNFAHFDKLLWWKDNGNYVINYLPFISTAAGIYVVFLLITFCVDVAIRVIKLCFLQMVAPIAIVSYIDPKESISNSKLSSWLKECASTYFSLFLRLATIFLVMLLISVISSMVLSENSMLGQQVSDITGDDIVYNIWIYVFLIIAAFMFAKQVPKIIESIFGIKGSGEFSLNPFKSVSNFLTTPLVAAGGAAVGGALGAAAANTYALGSNIRKNWGHNISDVTGGVKTGFQNLRTGFGSAGTGVDGLRNRAKLVGGVIKPVTSAASPLLGIGAGAVSGVARGARAGFTNKNIIKGANIAREETNQARYKRDVNQEAGYSFKDRALDSARSFAGVKNKDSGIGQQDKRIKELQREMDNLQSREHAVRDAQTQFAVQSKNAAVQEFTALTRKVVDSSGKETDKYQFANYNIDQQGNEQFAGFDYQKYEQWYKVQNGPATTPNITKDEFDRYTQMQSDIDYLDNQHETLRQEQSRLQDVSEASQINKNIK